MTDQDINYKHLGHLIQETRTGMRMTRAELAEKAGIAESYVVAIEKKADIRASLRVVVSIFKVLGLSLDRIFLHEADTTDAACEKILDLLQGCSPYELGVSTELVRSFLAYNRVHGN